MPRVLGLSHVGIFVRDLQASKEFYTRVLGFRGDFSSLGLPPPH